MALKDIRVRARHPMLCLPCHELELGFMQAEWLHVGGIDSFPAVPFAPSPLTHSPPARPLPCPAHLPARRYSEYEALVDKLLA